MASASLFPGLRPMKNERTQLSLISTPYVEIPTEEYEAVQAARYVSSGAHCPHGLGERGIIAS